MPGKKNFFITAPIYYPDDIPHLGAAYSTVTADCLARYHRLMGEDVFFSIGSDEHGQKVQEAAKARRKTPQEFLDWMIGDFATVWKKLQISQDDFIRTTEEHHIEVVEEIFRELLEKGDIYPGEFSGSYCVNCESFWSDSSALESKCPGKSCRGSVQAVEEKGYYFKLSKYTEPLLDHYQKNRGMIDSRKNHNLVVEALKEGLEDIFITRKGKIWGIPVPVDPDYKVYVWFEALLSYLSAAGYGTEDFEEYWPADIQVTGRDMLGFHAIVFPAICMALNIPLPKKILTQGWVVVGGKKISRSQHGSLNLVEIIDEFGPDVLRYYFLRTVNPGADLEFSKTGLISRLNNDLANDLGNLFYRSITMIMKYCDGIIPEPGGAGTFERNLGRVFKAVKNEYKKSMDKMEIREALRSVWDLVSALNRYIVDTAPWELHKDEKEEALHTALYTLMDYLRVITVLLVPFMPRAAIKMWRRLGFKDVLWNVKFDSVNAGILPPGQEVKKQSPLFPKVED